MAIFELIFSFVISVIVANKTLGFANIFSSANCIAILAYPFLRYFGRVVTVTSTIFSFFWIT